MKALIVTLALAGMVFAGCSDRHSPTATGTVDGLADIGAGLRGPAGLAATVYASGIPSASAFAFDSQGRLWVATAAFSDTGQDGVYVVETAGAQPRQVISGLHTALGLLWYRDSLYVASAGKVDAYSGFDGQRFTSSAPVLTLPAGVGEVNELVLGPDGRMRLGVSAPCDHCSPASEFSGVVLSFLPDGGDLRVEASGIRAAVGLAYHPRTGDLFVTMNQRDDLGENTPGDWLAIVHDGEDWGFPDCYGQGGEACVGTPQPVAVLDPHAAVSGVAIVTGQLGSVVGDSAIVAEWALGKVVAVRLKSDDSASGAPTTFLAGLKSPVPVLLGPGGALFVGDWATGTVYRVAASGG